MEQATNSDDQNHDFRQRYGEWAIVTGASSGIGAAFAHALAQRGVKPLLLARREEKLQQLAAEIKAHYNIDCEYLSLDLADHDFMQKLLPNCADKQIGLIIGNAAYNPLGAFSDMSAEQLQSILDINCRANLLLANAFLPKLKTRGSGGLLLVGSIEGYFGVPYSACYSASKAFVLSLGEALWGEYRGTGVDVLVLAPGATDTPLLASRQISSDKVSVMSPQAVAEIGLDNLHKGYVLIPGKTDRWLFRLLRRLPRRWAVTLTGKAVKKIVQR